MRRDDVASTSIQRHFDTKCPLGLGHVQVAAFFFCLFNVFCLFFVVLFLSLLLQCEFNINVSTQILLLFCPLWCPPVGIPRYPFIECHDSLWIRFLMGNTALDTWFVTGLAGLWSCENCKIITDVRMSLKPILQIFYAYLECKYLCVLYFHPNFLLYNNDL